MSGLVAVFGDSVTWGQGFHDYQKFVKTVAEALSATVSMHAHSGATIGVCNAETGSCPPEAPRHTPTTLQQLADSTDDPDQTWLVIVDGGINDVSVQYILNPFTSPSDLKCKVQQYCFQDMRTLLDKVQARYPNPNTKIVVTSYFPIFSPKSDFNMILEYLAKALFIAPSPMVAARGQQELFAGGSINLAMLFWSESTRQLKAAVDATQSSRVRFAYVPFTEDNAMFIKDTSWLFNVHLEGFELKAEDPMADSRKKDCLVCHAVDPWQIPFCNVASAGHPNFAGAAEFAKAILKVAR